jgi:hypothetical protein
MVEHPDLHPPPDDQPDVDKFAALADAPLTALGLSSSDADALGQALDVKSVRDLADNKYVPTGPGNREPGEPERLTVTGGPRAGIGRVRGGWATVHDRGTAEGWPPALGRAALPGAEPHVLAFAPGAGRSHRDGGRCRGAQPNASNTPSASQAEPAPREEPSLSGIGPCWVRSRPENRGQQPAAADTGRWVQPQVARPPAP